MLDKEDLRIRIITVESPFDVTKREIKEVDYLHGLSLGGYIDIDNLPYVVSLNGGVVEEQNLNLTYPAPGDTIVICPIPLGGGGGKNILRIVAMIALTVVTAGYGAAFAGALGVTGATGVAMVQAGMMIGGSLLINAVLPPAMPKINGAGSSDVEESSTYGIDGAKNTSNEDIPIPLCYGGYRMAGNIIGLHTENIGNTQYLYMLINAGEGPIAGISDIKINDQPLSSFDEVSTDVRLGTDNQAPIPWFNQTVKPNSLGSVVGTEWSTYRTQGEVDKLRLDFVTPKGLVDISKDSGDYRNRSVTIQVQIRKVGDAGWRDMPTPQYSGGFALSKEAFHDSDYMRDGTEYRDQHGNVIRGSDGAYVGYWWNEEPIHSISTTITAKQMTPVRASISSVRLEEAEYEVRWRRTNEQSNSKYISDELVITDVNEIITDKIGYNYTALLAVRIKLTDQLNGIPRVTYINEGLLIDTWDASSQKWIKKPSRNPAWIAYDLLTNSRYGGSLNKNRVDLVKLKEWAAFCDEQQFQFRGVLDTDGNIYDHIGHIFRAGHAKSIMMGTRYSFAIEKPDMPVMMFSESNIIENTFSIDWLPIEDRANEIEVTFFDEENDFTRRTIKIYDEKAFTAGEEQRSTSITLIGCTREEDALFEGQLALNMNRFIRQTVSFDASINAIACTIGDVIYVQHNMPQWGFGGKTLPGSTNSVIKLDMSAGQLSDTQRNIILIKGSAKNRHTGTITKILGNFVYVSGLVEIPDRVRRAVIEGSDMEIGEIIKDAYGVGFELFDTSYAGIGKTIELWDTDFFEERDVISFTEDSVTLSSPLSFVPEDYSDYLLGAAGKVKKPFRVIGIDYSHEYTRTIRAIEYNATLLDRWTYDLPTLNYSDIKKMGHSTIDYVGEELTLIGGNSFETTVIVDFSNTSDSYHKSVVHVSKNDGPYVEAGSHFSRVTFRGEEKATYKIKVVAVDASGSSLPFEEAPFVEHVVVGKMAPPNDVGEITLARTTGGLTIEWPQNADVDLKQYVVRMGKSWQNFEKEWVVAGNSLFVPVDREGEYSFHIIAEDTSGNVSENPTSASITLKPPADVMWIDASQIGEQITLTWKKPNDNSIVGYELRAGVTWGGSKRIARIDTTSYTFSVDSFGQRTYWIKAIDVVGLQSVNARFTTLDVARTSDRNLVFEQDHEALGYDGSRINLDGIDNLIMKSGSSYSEYRSKVEMPYLTKARNVLYMDSYSVYDDTVTWEQANFTWEDTNALKLWEPNGDSDSTETEAQLALKRRTASPELFSVSFDGSATSENGVQSASNVKTSYDTGRFFNGVKLSDFSNLTYRNLTIPDKFGLRFWIKAATNTGSTSGMYLRLISGSDTMTLVYDSVVKQFVLLCSDGAEMRVSITMTEMDVVLVAISQSDNERRLMVGKPTGEYAIDTVNQAPMGQITGIDLTS